MMFSALLSLIFPFHLTVNSFAAIFLWLNLADSIDSRIVFHLDSDFFFVKILFLVVVIIKIPPK